MLPLGNAFETLEPYPAPPWEKPLGFVQNIGLNQEGAATVVMQQAAEEKQDGACVMFTEGSFIPGIGGGAAVALEVGVTAAMFGPNDVISNHEMEGKALLMALRDAQDRLENPSFTDKYESLALFSDSQAELGLINNPPRQTTAQYIALDLCQMGNNIRKKLQLTLYWTPGHQNITRNEAEDEAGRTAAENQENLTDLPESLSSLKLRCKKVFRSRGAGCTDS